MLKPLLTMALGAALLVPATAQAEGFTPEQKKELEAMFEAYLLQNGDKVMQSVENYQVQEQVRQMEQAKANISNNADYLYNSGSPSFGPEDADVTIVEFFDYNCGYCKKAIDELQEVLKDDDNIRVIFKEMPILAPTSHEAAQWALAADKQGKYFEFHSKLMHSTLPKNEDLFKKVAKELGLDMKKLEKDKDDPAVLAMIEKNIAMSKELGVRGTPAFIIGNEFSPGYIPAAQMKEMIAKTRASSN